MGNKTQLQQHNSTLQNQILTAIQNLPGGVQYTGDNPLTIGTEGFTLPANTLLKEALQIINGVEPGVTGVDVGQVTCSNQTSLTIYHNLGQAPKMFLLAQKNPKRGARIGFVAYPRSNYDADLSNMYQLDCYGSGDYPNPFNISSNTISFTLRGSTPLNGTYDWVATL